MDKYLAYVDFFSDKPMLFEVRHLTDEEKKSYIPEVWDMLFVPTGERELYHCQNHLEHPDFSRRAGIFHYGANCLYIITEEEWQNYVELDKRITAEKEQAKKAAAPAIKHDVEKERAYDMAHNEGGEGYNPYRIGSTPTYWTGHRTQEEPIED